MVQSDLFGTSTQFRQNHLPYDGTVEYFGRIMSHDISEQIYEQLFKEIEWKNDIALIYGRRIETKRKVAWYGDHPFEYTYSNYTKRALAWNPILHELKDRVEEESKETYNSCLLNLYHNGTEGMAWHSDDEKDLVKHGTIGSLSFGGERKFSFKHKRTKATVSLVLEHGSLLLMRGETQSNWLHRLPPTRKKKRARINLTFRTISV